ncbi:unnamed protein product [Calypogeia fissa]
MVASPQTGKTTREQGAKEAEQRLKENTMTRQSTQNSTSKPRAEQLSRPALDVHQFDDPNEIVMSNGTIRRMDGLYSSNNKEKEKPRHTFTMSNRGMDMEMAMAGKATKNQTHTKENGIDTTMKDQGSPRTKAAHNRHKDGHMLLVETQATRFQTIGHTTLCHKE